MTEKEKQFEMLSEMVKKMSVRALLIIQGMVTNSLLERLANGDEDLNNGK